MNQCNMHPIASIVHSDPDAELPERPYTWQRNVFCEMIWARCDKHLLENSSWIVQSHVQGMRPSSWCRTGGLARRSSPSWEAGCGHVNITCKGRKAAQTSQATWRPSDLQRFVFSPLLEEFRLWCFCETRNSQLWVSSAVMFLVDETCERQRPGRYKFDLSEAWIRLRKHMSYECTHLGLRWGRQCDPAVLCAILSRQSLPFRDRGYGPEARKHYEPAAQH